MKKVEDENFVSIFSPSNPLQAGMIREAFEQADIISYVNNEHTASNQFGGIGLGAAKMRVMVCESQVKQAHEIIHGLGLE